MVTYRQSVVVMAITYAVVIAMAIGIFGFGLPREIALIAPWPLTAISLITLTWLNSETRARWRQSRARRSSPAR